MDDGADDYAASIHAWDAERDARLRSPNGWLALVGLHWLTPGEHEFGQHPSNAIRLTGGDVPPLGGHLLVTDDGVVRIRPHGDASLTHDGQPVNGELELRGDLSGDPTIVELGSLRFHLIRRGDRIGLRVRDTAAPILKEFPGVPRFPIDPAWRVSGRLERPPGLRTVDVPDVLGEVRAEESPGVVQFSMEGQDLALDALPEDDDALWLIFGDTTNGHETYSGGRFLVSGPVAEDGSVVVDFNLAYNPPCVFSPHATCPLPWPANVLPVAVRAGEQMPGQPDR
jgi:uncharacterized protein